MNKDCHACWEHAHEAAGRVFKAATNKALRSMDILFRADRGSKHWDADLERLRQDAAAYQAALEAVKTLHLQEPARVND